MNALANPKAYRVSLIGYFPTGADSTVFGTFVTLPEATEYARKLLADKEKTLSCDTFITPIY